MHARGREALERAFWAKVQRTDGCWLWTGCGVPKGYGYIGTTCLGRYRTYTHRLSWEFAYGPVPDGMDVLHHCDTPPCVRPDHLFLGTVADNNRDKARKGRAPRGETHPNATFTAPLVIEIRQRVAAGEPIKAVARSLGRPYLSVYYIAKRLSWAHVAEAH